MTKSSPKKSSKWGWHTAQHYPDTAMTYTKKESASFYAGRPFILDCKSSPNFLRTHDY